MKEKLKFKPKLYLKQKLTNLMSLRSPSSIFSSAIEIERIS